jgi:hypothetical protein
MHLSLYVLAFIFFVVTEAKKSKGCSVGGRYGGFVEGAHGTGSDQTVLTGIMSMVLKKGAFTGVGYWKDASGNQVSDFLGTYTFDKATCAVAIEFNSLNGVWRASGFTGSKGKMSLVDTDADDFYKYTLNRTPGKSQSKENSIFLNHVVG